MVRLAALMGVAVFAALPAPMAIAARDDTVLASPHSSGGSADGDSITGNRAISGDGRYLAFFSTATDLSAGDSDAASDVFVRDLDTGSTILVSRASGVSGSKGTSDSYSPVISQDGRYVAFSSVANNLDPADADNVGDVFVRDLQTNTTTLVSRATTAVGAKGNGDSSVTDISADGGSVTFFSLANNLDLADTNAFSDVFVRDVPAATTTLVSRANGAAGVSGNGNSNSSAMSSDGRLVAFSSVATNFTTDDTDPIMDVFLRDRVAGTTTLVSRNTGVTGDKGNGASTLRSISGDGGRVAFHTASTNFDPADLDSTRDVYVRDRVSSDTTLISRAAGAAGAKASGGSSTAGGMSADGRYVSFSTTGMGIHPDDADSVEDVFVRDLDTGGLVLVSRASGAAGPKGDARSINPALSSDGRFAAFSSSASNLAPGSDNAFDDVFRRDLLSPPAASAATPGPGPAQAQPSPPPPTKLAVAFGKARYRLVHGRRLRISYTSSLAASAVLEIRKGKRVLARVKQTARKGKNRITWNGRYRRRGSKRATAAPAGSYTLRLVAKAGGRSASAKARLTVIRR